MTYNKAPLKISAYDTTELTLSSITISETESCSWDTASNMQTHKQKDFVTAEFADLYEYELNKPFIDLSTSTLNQYTLWTHKNKFSEEHVLWYIM